MERFTQRSLLYITKYSYKSAFIIFFIIFCFASVIRSYRYLKSQHIFSKKNAELNIQLYKTLKVLWNKNRVTLEVIWMMSDLYILNI